MPKRTYIKTISVIILLIISSLSLIGCNDKKIESSLSQCQIDAYSLTGENFINSLNKQHNKLLNQAEIKNDPDFGYRNWMLLCMNSKGYKFKLYKKNEPCWSEPPSMTITDVYNQECYLKHN